ncbi:MAG TPA: CAP domain-containing protein [Chondromyces sp.]|nr:CAP domain-containing protein [Chondromyces sp.]
MNKKMMLSVAASLAILGTPFASKADAAEPASYQSVKVYKVQWTSDNLQQFGFQPVKWANFNKSYTGTQAAPKAEQTAKPVETTKQPEATPAQTETTKQPASSQSGQAASSVKAFEQQVVDLTNKERAKAGLPALALDTELSKVARKKSEDMLAKNYFSHTSPTYGSPFDMMKQFGISYRSAGENIAKGQRSPEEVVNAWMNSEGHRANILNKDFTHIGVGYVENGNIWTQMFIKK